MAHSLIRPGPVEGPVSSREPPLVLISAAVAIGLLLGAFVVGYLAWDSHRQPRTCYSPDSSIPSSLRGQDKGCIVAYGGPGWVRSLDFAAEGEVTVAWAYPARVIAGGTSGPTCSQELIIAKRGDPQSPRAIIPAKVSQGSGRWIFRGSGMYTIQSFATCTSDNEVAVTITS